MSPHSQEAPDNEILTQDETAAPETPETLKTRPYVANIYRAVIGAVLLLAAKAGYEAYTSSRHPDPRPAEEVVRSYLTWRSQMSPEMKKSVGDITDEKVKRLAEEATCQMQLMNFTDSEMPQEPKEPVLPKGADLSDKAKFEYQKRNYPFAKQNYKRQLELWSENRKTRGQFVYVAGLPASLYTPKILAPEQDEQQKQAVRFDYHRNTRNYILRLRHKERIQKLRDMTRSDEKHFEGQLGWMKQGLAEYRKSHPAEAGKDTKEWEAKTAEDYISQAYLDQPLTPVYGCNGEPSVTKDKMPCLLVKPAADALTRANRRLCENNKPEIKFDICYRSNLYDSVTYTSNNGIGCGLEGAREGVSLPGTSNHETGMAADISNWNDVEPYLITEAAWFCNLKNDLGHCSATEFELGEALWIEILDAYRVVFGKEMIDALKDVVGGVRDIIREKVKIKL